MTRPLRMTTISIRNNSKIFFTRSTLIKAFVLSMLVFPLTIRGSLSSTWNFVCLLLSQTLSFSLTITTTFTRALSIPYNIKVTTPGCENSGPVRQYRGGNGAYLCEPFPGNFHVTRQVDLEDCISRGS